jgi:hypothetical protein
MLEFRPEESFRLYAQIGSREIPALYGVGLPLSLEPKRTLRANLTFGRSERATDGASKSLPARSRLVEGHIRNFDQGPHEQRFVTRLRVVWQRACPLFQPSPFCR